MIGTGVWLFWIRSHPVDERPLTGKLEASVNEILNGSGVTDSQITGQFRKEHEAWGIRWIESSRRVVLSAGQDRETIISRLSNLAKKKGFVVSMRSMADGATVLDMSTVRHLLERLIFAQGPKISAHPQVAIVIDDVAYDLRPMDRYKSLGVPLTFAILPRDRRCAALALKAKRLGFGVLLHLPMEPFDLAHNNPGNAALYLKMTPEQLHQQFEADIASVPGIDGINNHMGSAFTSDMAKMELVMRWTKEKNLFFLDSRTAPHSVALAAARRHKVPCLANETFLDNADNVGSIQHQLDGVLVLALKYGRTIAIGHYRRKYLADALSKEIPKFRAHGVEFVTLSTLYK